MFTTQLIGSLKICLFGTIIKVVSNFTSFSQLTERLSPTLRVFCFISCVLNVIIFLTILEQIKMMFNFRTNYFLNYFLFYFCQSTLSITMVQFVLEIVNLSVVDLIRMKTLYKILVQLILMTMKVIFYIRSTQIILNVQKQMYA